MELPDPALLDKRYAQYTVTAEGGKVTEVPASFEPDLWQIQAKSEPASPVYLAQRNDLQPGRPMRSSGQSILNGVGGRILYIYNSGVGSLTIFVTASKGYPQEAIATPMSVARPATVAPQALGMSAVNPFNITHPGGAILLFVTSTLGASADGKANSVSIGGIPMALIRRDGSVGSPGEFSSIWLLYGVTAGVVQVSVVFAGAPTFEIYAYSMDDGIRTGNVSGATGTTSPFSVTIVDTEDTSVAMALIRVNVVDLGEGSGAQLYSVGSTNSRIWRRPGVGSQQFSWTPGANRYSVSAVELALGTQ